MVEESSLYREPLSEAEWNEALGIAESRLRGLHHQSASAIVARIDRAISRLDPIMTRYCDQTCPDCVDPCCRGKRIFFNLADILVLAVRSTGLPPGQTRSAAGESCRFWTSKGCTLSRYHRPYVCVWFLCEPQMELLAGEKARFQRDFLQALGEIREGRWTLESLYREVREAEPAPQTRRQNR